MKSKLLTTLLLTIFCVSAFGQSMGSVEGFVADADKKGGINGAEVKLIGVSTMKTETYQKGAFSFKNVLPGEYQLIAEANAWQGVSRMIVVKAGEVTNLGVILLKSEYVGRRGAGDIDEFDLESGDGGEQSMPVLLSASKDVFDNVAGYKFSSMRFRTRGYDSGMTDVYLNGVYFNDALTGYSPWSLWSGLNDATRNQEVTSGAAVSDYGVGGVNGTTNINARASQIRKGYRLSFVNASGQYRFRVMATYGSGELDNGWSYALSVSTRQGGNNWIDGIYYNSWGYFGSVEKRINPFHRIGFTFMGTPGERAAQGASTQEVYDLVGSNFYNSNWGYQSGSSKSDMRSARVRDSHEPIAMLNYIYEPNSKFRLTAAASFRFGKNGYSALDWHDAQDPRPDYYRNLPSYFLNVGETDKAAAATKAWREDVNTRHINWDKLYNTNYGSRFKDDGTQYYNDVNPTGSKRSQYVVEDRRADQRDFNAKVQVMSVLSNRSKINVGIDARINRTEYFKTVKDLLGGDYYLDVDQFAERDFGDGEQAQSNLHTYNRLVQKGDKYGYDYYAHVHNYKLWATYHLALPMGLEISLAAEGGNSRMWREGLYRKGLFEYNSYGDSEKQNFWTYTVKAGINYRISGTQMVYANFTNMRVAPYFKDAFVSARTRNTIVPDLTAEKVTSVDLNYSLRTPGLKLRATGFFTKISDRMKQISFYDDAARLTEEGRAGMFTNFSMSGIDQIHTGMELGVSVPIIAGISAEGALSYGLYKYTSNPFVTQTVDNNEMVILNKELVRWKDMKVEGTPQTAVSLGLKYQGPKNIYAGIDMNYFDAMYLSMNPLYRTDRAHYGLTWEESQTLAQQELFKNSFILNANFSKSWYLGRYNLGFSFEVKNILNDRKIKTGGYEQMRLKKIPLRKVTQLDENNKPVVSKDEIAATDQRYQRFDSKYFYLMGTNYYLNIYLRF